MRKYLQTSRLQHNLHYNDLLQTALLLLRKFQAKARYCEIILSYIGSVNAKSLPLYKWGTIGRLLEFINKLQPLRAIDYPTIITAGFDMLP